MGVIPQDCHVPFGRMMENNEKMMNIYIYTLFRATLRSPVRSPSLASPRCSRWGLARPADWPTAKTCLDPRCFTRCPSGFLWLSYGFPMGSHGFSPKTWKLSVKAWGFGGKLVNLASTKDGVQRVRRWRLSSSNTKPWFFGSGERDHWIMAYHGNMPMWNTNCKLPAMLEMDRQQLEIPRFLGLKMVSWRVIPPAHTCCIMLCVHV
jgi:hypothetical protein